MQASKLTSRSQERRKLWTFTMELEQLRRVTPRLWEQGISMLTHQNPSAVEERHMLENQAMFTQGISSHFQTFLHRRSKTHQMTSSHSERTMWFRTSRSTTTGLQRWKVSIQRTRRRMNRWLDNKPSRELNRKTRVLAEKRKFHFLKLLFMSLCRQQ